MTPAEPPPGTIYLPKAYQTRRRGNEPTAGPSPTRRETAEPTAGTAEPTAGTAEPTGIGTADPTQSPTPGQGQMDVALNEMGGSGKSGEAMLTEEGADLVVELSVVPSDPADAHPAHIHVGSCASQGGVIHPLDPVLDGSSHTVLAGVGLTEVADGMYYINVHESAANMANILACGNIPEWIPPTVTAVYRR